MPRSAVVLETSSIRSLRKRSGGPGLHKPQPGPGLRRVDGDVLVVATERDPPVFRRAGCRLRRPHGCEFETWRNDVAAPLDISYLKPASFQAGAQTRPKLARFHGCPYRPRYSSITRSPEETKSSVPSDRTAPSFRHVTFTPGPRTKMHVVLAHGDEVHPVDLLQMAGRTISVKSHSAQIRSFCARGLGHSRCRDWPPKRLLALRGDLNLPEYAS